MVFDSPRRWASLLGGADARDLPAGACHRLHHSGSSFFFFAASLLVLILLLCRRRSTSSTATCGRSQASIGRETTGCLVRSSRRCSSSAMRGMRLSVASTQLVSCHCTLRFIVYCDKGQSASLDCRGSSESVLRPVCVLRACSFAAISRLFRPYLLLDCYSSVRKLHQQCFAALASLKELMSQSATNPPPLRVNSEPLF